VAVFTSTFGSLVTVQVVPERVSATGMARPVVSTALPTATHAVDEVQETPVIVVGLTTVGCGRFLAVHGDVVAAAAGTTPIASGASTSAIMAARASRADAARRERVVLVGFMYLGGE
jgi:hypothetical protein